MRKPKRLRFSYNSLQPVTTHYAPAAWRVALPWLAVADGIHEAVLGFRGLFDNSLRPRRFQESPAGEYRVPAGSAVHVYKPDGTRVFLGTTV